MRFSYLKTKIEVAAVIAALNSRGLPVVLDIETTGLDRFKDKLISVQLCVAGDEHSYYFDAEHAGELANLTCSLVLHNFKFDFAFLFGACGIDLRKCPMGVPGRARVVRDTMLMHHLLDENAEHSLDALVQERWNDPYKEVFWSRNQSFQGAPEEERIEYACKDVVYTGLLYGHLHNDLVLSGVPESLIDHVHKLALALYETEVSGVRVDLDYLTKVGSELKSRIDSAVTRMREACPEVSLVETNMWLAELEKRKTEKGKAGVKRPVFNWDSGKQLQALLYGELQLPVQTKWDKKTKAKKPTLEDDALEELEGLHPVITEIRAQRADRKVYGSFIEGTLERQVGGRIYPSFNINGTVTGRISSSNPNLQQLPREGGVRGIYIPDPGYKFLSCDYGMLEVVIAAHYSQDKSLLKIIYEGASKHDITAEGLGIPRLKAKTVNFAMQYLCSPFKVAQILGCSKQEGLYAWNKYWETYAGEKKVVEECKALVDAGKPIVSLFGRRRRFPNVFASEHDRARAHRQAYSSLIQGTGADLTHWAYYTVAQSLERSGRGRAVFQVHDEILVEARDGALEAVSKELQQTMISSGVRAQLSVPLTVDCSPPLERWTK